MWQAFVQWFANVIQFMYGITQTIGVPSYGLAIVLITIVIKIVIFPLTQKQMKSMRTMQVLQPRMKYIQDKYKDDPETMQKKIMEMYKEAGTSPLAGCLPLLIQMPIFIAFYQSLLHLEYKVAAHAAFLGIPHIGKSVTYYVTHGEPLVLYVPLLAALTTYLQQRVSMVNVQDPTQKSMLYFMPIFMGYIAATLPAGLPIYWIMFNILGILQQLYVNRMGNKELLDTGTGVTFTADLETPTQERKEENLTEEQKEEKRETGQRQRQSEGKIAGRDKGGKRENERPNNYRKKRKKR